jgi:hypothetical protein
MLNRVLDSPPCAVLLLGVVGAHQLDELIEGDLLRILAHGKTAGDLALTLAKES